MIDTDIKLPQGRKGLIAALEMIADTCDHNYGAEGCGNCPFELAQECPFAMGILPCEWMINKEEPLIDVDLRAIEEVIEDEFKKRNSTEPVDDDFPL